MTTTTTTRTVWTLARLAGCADPDTTTSAGATFLRAVEAHVTEAISYGIEDRSDTAHEVADAAVPVYTCDRWATFTDVAAWQEDPAELGSTPADMTEAAGVALYLVAYRLAAALLDHAQVGT